jgi:hypothetical protein
LTNGNKGTIVKATSTLTDQANVSWAKAFTGEFILTWDSFSSNAVGSGRLHYKDNSNVVRNSMALYYYDFGSGTTGLAFGGEDAGSSFAALTLKGSFDGSCYDWFRTAGSYSLDKCIAGFQSGLGEVWSISNSNSNTFSSSTEFTGMQYYPAAGGSATNWSSAPGSIYCHDDGGFTTTFITNWNSWNVAPPGSGTACGGIGFTSAKPIAS